MYVLECNICALCVCRCRGGQKKVSGLLELLSEAIESCLVLVLGRDLGSFPEQHVSLTAEPSV